MARSLSDSAGHWQGDIFSETKQKAGITLRQALILSR